MNKSHPGLIFVLILIEYLILIVCCDDFERVRPCYSSGVTQRILDLS